MDIILEELSRNMPASTTENLTYYISTAGNDNNDGLTTDTSFATIAKALSMLPQIIDHTIMIYIANGEYNEDVNISDYVGVGSIGIIGDTSRPRNVILSSITISNCYCNIKISGVKLIK